MLFNKHNELTYTEIKDATNIPEADLKEALKYLCNPRQKILEKENAKTPEFQPNEKTKIVATFANPNVKVNYVPMPVEKKEVAAANQVDPFTDERKNILDAVIVRIMKARKTEKHNQLLEDVIKQISMFLPQPQWIKMRIESLIEREYLKRDENDRSKYIYLP